MEEEYVFAKDFTLLDVASSEIYGDVFKCMYRDTYPKFIYKKGSAIPDDWTAYPEPNEPLSSLECYGFIKKKVNDPSVKVGDCFKSDKGVSMVVCIDKNFLDLVPVDVLDMKSNLITAWTAHASKLAVIKYRSRDFQSNYKNIRLSHLVGKDNLRFFKPVKITVTVD